jgi:signal transduction histidine kinase
VAAADARISGSLSHVHNHGGPIAGDLLAHIFEPMRRGEQSVKLGSRSIGLGLYIVKEIVSAHAGLVTVTSTEAEGTAFLVRLPRDVEPLARAAPPETR